MILRLFSIFCCLTLSNTLYSQLAEVKQIKIGQLQSWFSRAGGEIEVGRTHATSDQQDGLRWPEQFYHQDSEVAKALWIGCINYNDPIAATLYPHKVVHIGPRHIDEDYEFMPVEFKMIARHDNPQVFVNGANAYNLYGEVLDEINPILKCDRMIYNVVNTSIGVTIKRRIYDFTNKGHDNYFIYDYTFKNTGIYDTNGSIHNMTLEGVLFHWQYRYAIAREACTYGGYWLPQSATWGHNTMNDQSGGQYGLSAPPRVSTNYVPPRPNSIMRTLFSWSGRHSKWYEPGSSIGAPNWKSDGHLGAVQFVGTVVLFADNPNNIGVDDSNQPFSTYHCGSDNEYTYGNSQFNAAKMTGEYNTVMNVGFPNPIHADGVGDNYADLYGGTPGGYSQTHTFGPFTMAPGDSVHIVLAEGVAGLDREFGYIVGANWIDWGYGGSVHAPYTLPDGSTSTDGDLYKNKWMFTGVDSLFKTFTNAVDNYSSGINLPVPPQPPDVFEVLSGDEFITLTWSDNASLDPNFSGYEIYRSVSTPDTTFEKIFACGPNTNHPAVVHSYDDASVIHGFDYYYYVVSVNDGSNNGGVPMRSSLFWTRTNQPAYLVSGLGGGKDKFPKQFMLHQNFPNPFNPTTIIRYDLPKQSEVKLIIYDLYGREVKRLVHENQIPGQFTVSWDALDERGIKVSSGFYVYKLIAGDYIESRKMLLMK